MTHMTTSIPLIPEDFEPLLNILSTKSSESSQFPFPMQSVYPYISIYIRHVSYGMIF